MSCNKTKHFNRQPLTKKCGLVLLVGLVFAGILFNASSAQAFLDVPYNISQHQLDALDFIDFIPRQLLNIMLLAGEMSVFAIISAKLLDFASTQPAYLEGNPLVEMGWNFTSGLANIVFILIFIFIAFSYILKLETWGMKKALPRLIIIAFLLNFSLLFVGMFVDISWIVQNSFKEAFFVNGSLTASLIKPIIDGASKILFELGAQLGAYALLGLAPFGPGVRAIIWLTIAMPTEVFFGSFSYAILFIIFGWTIGLTLLVYSILFLLRIAVIWMLAIAAPLAFAAYILPQTEKYFKQWLHALIQWSFLGIIALFLAGLGIRLFTYLFPEVGPLSTTGASGADFNFVANYTRFIFLIIYLWASLLASIKLAPKGTEMVLGVGGAIAQRGGALAAGGARQLAIREEVWRSGIQAKRATARIAPLRAKETAGTITTRERAQLGKWTTRKETAEARTQMLTTMRIQSEENELSKKTKGMNEDPAKAFLRLEMEKHKQNPLRNKARTAALMKQLLEKGAENDSDLNSGMYLEAWKAAGPEDWKKNPVKKAASARKPDWGTAAERKVWILNAGANMDKWANSSKENDAVVKEVVATMRPDLISRLGSQTKVSMEKVRKEVDNTLGGAWRDLGKGMMDMGEFTKHVATLNADQRRNLLQQLEVIRYLHFSTAPHLRTWKKYGSIEKGEPDNVTDRVNAARRTLRP